MRKILIITIFAVLSAAPAALQAQSLDAFKQRLGVPVLNGTGRVVVTEYGDAAKAVAQASRNTARQRFQGYRVCIFFGNGQGARAGAAAARALFESNFAGARVYSVYEAPYFKVTVGNCLTSEEAIILKGRISGVFPKAFLKNEELSLGDLLN